MPIQAMKGGARISWTRAARILRATLATGLVILMAGAPGLLRGADRWRGADVTVRTISGEITKGELIGVREDAVVVLAGLSEKTLMVAEIESVRIARKSPTFVCVVLGGFVGGIAAGLIARRPSTTDDLGTGLKRFFGYPLWLSVGLVAGALSGIGIAQAIGKDKVIVFKDRPAAEVEAGLKALRNEARIPKYK
ncbi:MAG: hypothetical protein ABSG73_08640 [Candidatus Aminicenantales bacterium]|jgi:hypothetical protein